MIKILDFLLGWNYKVRKLRKGWDRTREKSLKKKDPIKQMALHKLDVIENNLRMLEEQNLSKMDKSRISKQVEIEIEEVKGLLKMKPKEVMDTMPTKTA